MVDVSVVLTWKLIAAPLQAVHLAIINEVMNATIVFMELGTVDLVVHGDLHRSLYNTLKEGKKERPLMQLNILILSIFIFTQTTDRLN